jgi:hypothetical protein
LHSLEIITSTIRKEVIFSHEGSAQNQKIFGSIGKKGLVGLVPKVNKKIPCKALDETVLRIQTRLMLTAMEWMRMVRIQKENRKFKYLLLSTFYCSILCHPRLQLW